MTPAQANLWRPCFEGQYAAASLSREDRDDTWQTAVTAAGPNASRVQVERAYESAAHVSLVTERVVQEQAAKRLTRSPK